VFLKHKLGLARVNKPFPSLERLLVFQKHKVL